MLPGSNKKILQLGDDIAIDCIELVGNMQDICIWLTFTSKLVSNGGNDLGPSLCFFELSRAEKVATQNGMLVSAATLLEPPGYGICYGSFTRAGLAGQPEDTGAVR